MELLHYLVFDKLLEHGFLIRVERPGFFQLLHHVKRIKLELLCRADFFSKDFDVGGHLLPSLALYLLLILPPHFIHFLLDSKLGNFRMFLRMFS